jgi:hypothetical protein
MPNVGLDLDPEFDSEEHKFLKAGEKKKFVTQYEAHYCARMLAVRFTTKYNLSPRVPRSKHSTHRV